MDNEDITSAKLKGFNLMIKFIDGETIFLKMSDDYYDMAEFFEVMNNFLAKKESHFPVSYMSANRDIIKYVKKI